MYTCIPFLDDFRRSISVFAIFSYGIAVLGTPQCPPLKGMISSSNFVEIARLVVLARKDPGTTSPFSSLLDPLP